MARGFTSPVWMTFKQARELGAVVRKGETGSTVVFASRFTKSEADGNGRGRPGDPFPEGVLRVQCGPDRRSADHHYHRPEPALDPVERIENADRFFRNTGAVIRHGGTQAYYSPVTDHIQMPPFQTFRDAASYTSTLSHEATHWTANPRRARAAISAVMPRTRASAPARNSLPSSAAASYAPTLESYRARPQPDHASYLASWLAVLSKTGGRFFRPRPLMRRGQSPSCTICSLMQLRRKSRLKNQRRSLHPPTADTSLGSLCSSALIWCQVQLAPDRGFAVGRFELSGLLDFDGKRLCLLTHVSSRRRIASTRYRVDYWEATPWPVRRHRVALALRRRNGSTTAMFRWVRRWQVAISVFLLTRRHRPRPLRAR